MSPLRRNAGPARARVVALVNNLDGVFQQSVLQGATQTLEEQVLALEVVALGAAGEPDVLQRMAAVAQRAGGLLVISNAVSDAALRAAMAEGAVATLVSHHTRDAQGPPTLMFDNRQGLQQLVSHLVHDCGRTLPVYIGGDPTQLDAQERERAFLAEAVRNDLRVPEENLLRGDFTPERAGEALQAFIAAGGRFDSVVAADYLMASAAQDALRAAGLDVPLDVAVVGYGDGPEAEAAGVTTVAADVVELGRRAARQLLAQLAGRSLTGRTLLSTHLVRRASSC